MRISAQLAFEPICTVWMQYDDATRLIAQVDSDGAILWGTADQPCEGTSGHIGLGPCIRRRQQSDWDIVAYLPEEGT